MMTDPTQQREGKREMPRATAGQMGRQVALILIVLAVWTVLLVVFST
jgi:hypothetical protein